MCVYLLFLEKDNLKIIFNLRVDQMFERYLETYLEHYTQTTLFSISRVEHKCGNNARVQFRCKHNLASMASRDFMKCL